MRTLAMPKTAEPWSLTSLREKLIKIGAKNRTFQSVHVEASKRVALLTRQAGIRHPGDGRFS
jgi:hypothetical protein